MSRASSDTAIPATEALVRELDADLETASPRDVLAVCAARFTAGRVAVVSAFGPGTMVLLDMMAEQALRLPVVFIDTLHHFPETLKHVAHVRRRYDLDLRVYRPAADRAAFEAHHGPHLWERDLSTYQQLTKVEPFRRAIADLDGVITGRRRDQSETRAGLRVLEWRGEPPLRINPLAHWSGADVWTYIELHSVPVNPLHAQGYTSIGDEPLTTPVAPDEHERAGRWRGTGVLECGIHTRDSC